MDKSFGFWSLKGQVVIGAGQNYAAKSSKKNLVEIYGHEGNIETLRSANAGRLYDGA